MGYLMVQMRVTIQGIDNRNPIFAMVYPATVPGYIDALFAGVLLETVFLASAHAYHITQLK